ncbi:Crp/Fnr family transcriptional regulator [Aquimarina sp. AD10]|uniref:Cyclic nucleotide-binding domain-containing protein n=1 Tax=Aquimarina aggregata TaxID=1642818 RepID=A0A162CU03_9FLAO|nr:MULTISPECIES: Crp/Fnr family transcriptional regulator [Aquimarina]AXT62525.1 Crp/Fnr family transcriptional regulator [Aquimarina sp. AD10]KZS41029.1 hypothetical protein AWE51_24060 [Aquimarina aggregata]RKM90283.1 Crp/Fnr family transcriptional regulator [Aquimarina sp. AD10]
MKTSVKDYLSSFIKLSPEIENEVLSIYENRSYKKMEHFMKCDSAADKIAFVREGILRAYETNCQGEEITISFYAAPCFALDFVAFQEGKSTTMNIQALTPAKLQIANINDVYTLNEKYAVLGKIHIKLLEDLYCYHKKRETSFILNSATERYLNFINTKQELFNTIPQHYIASYLGIKPQSLSRIRTKLSKQSPSDF